MPDWNRIAKNIGGFLLNTAQTLIVEAEKKGLQIQSDGLRELQKYERQLRSYSFDSLKEIAQDTNHPIVKRRAAYNIAKDLKTGVRTYNSIESKTNKSMKSSSSYYNNGLPNIKVGFILSAPGRLEERSGRPASGNTGKNLDLLISILNLKYPQLFPSKNRYSYRITNAVTDVHYASKTNDTEGKNSEVLNKNNIDRILSEISGLTDVFCFGEKALLLKNELISRGFNGSIYSDIHLGLQSINRKITEDINGNPLNKGADGNTQKRIEVIANRIGNEIEKKR